MIFNNGLNDLSSTSTLKGIVHQFYKLSLNEAFFCSDPEDVSHSFVSFSKLLKKAKTLAFTNAPIRTPKYKDPLM